MKPCFAFHGNTLLLKSTPAGEITIPTADEITSAAETTGELHEVTMNDGRIVNAIALAAEPTPPDGWITTGLRASYDLLPPDIYDAAGKAYQILYWDSHSRYCPVCGTPTVRRTPIMKKCPQCGNELYPQGFARSDSAHHPRRRRDPARARTQFPRHILWPRGRICRSRRNP